MITISASRARALGCLAAACALLLGAGLSACATAGGGGVTSPYFHTADGYFYKYGNFCGPGWPVYPEGNTPRQNIALIDSIEPVDDIDRVCRAHDRCYFEYGKDNKQCDAMLAELLRDHSRGAYVMSSSSEFLANEFSGQCANLAGEILNAVGKLKQGDYIASLANDDQARTQQLTLLGFSALGNLAAGFPQTPGLCFFSDVQLTDTAAPATTALRAAAQLASASGVDLASFEPFPPASEASLAPGRRALAARKAELAAAKAAGAAPAGSSALQP